VLTNAFAPSITLGNAARVDTDMSITSDAKTWRPLEGSTFAWASVGLMDAASSFTRKSDSDSPMIGRPTQSSTVKNSATVEGVVVLPSTILPMTHVLSAGSL
jgi:hypothetical protein